MNKKILPLGIPKIRGYLVDALPLSIISTKDDYLPWLYSNYIQVSCRKDIHARDELKFEFYDKFQGFNSPFLEKQSLTWEFLAHMNIDIIEFVIQCIDLDYYFFGYVDDFYVPFRPGFQKEHFPHDMFLYGYDKEKEIFYTYGYDSNNVLSKCEISFQLFQMSFVHNDWDKQIYFWIDRIHIVKYNHNIKYDLDVELMIELMEDYLYSRNTSRYDRRYTNLNQIDKFGLDTYGGIREYYQLLMKNEFYLDIRVPYILYEHKKCMWERLSYIYGLYKEDVFLDYIKEYETMFHIARCMTSLSIKYSIKANEKYLQKSIMYLDQLEQMERDLLPKIIHSLKLDLHNNLDNIQ